MHQRFALPGESALKPPAYLRRIARLLTRKQDMLDFHKCSPHSAAMSKYGASSGKPSLKVRSGFRQVLVPSSAVPRAGDIGETVHFYGCIKRGEFWPAATDAGAMPNGRRNTRDDGDAEPPELAGIQDLRRER